MISVILRIKKSRNLFITKFSGFNPNDGGKSIDIDNIVLFMSIEKRIRMKLFYNFGLQLRFCYDVVRI